MRAPFYPKEQQRMKVMIFHKPLMIAALIALGISSCQQNTLEAERVIISRPDRVTIQRQNEAQRLAEEKAKQRIAEKKRQLEDQHQKIAAKAEKRRAQIASNDTIFTPPPWRKAIPEPQPKPQRPKYRVASSVKGRPGFVYNPFTWNPVDVRGYRSRSIVVDPNDPAGRKHAFQLP